MASTPEDEFDSDTPLDSPSPTFGSPNISPSPSPSPNLEPPRPAIRSISTNGASAASMTPSSTPLGNINAARNPRPSAPTMASRGSGFNYPKDILERIQAVHLGRQGAPRPNGTPSPMSPSIGRSVSASPGAPLPGGPPPSGQLPSGQLPNGPFPGGVPPNFRLPQATKPSLPNFQSAPAVPNVRSAGGSKPLSMMERRGLKMAGGLPGAASPTNTTASPKRKGPSFKLSDVHGADSAAQEEPKMESMMDKFSQFIDKETGSLKLDGKAVLNAEGIKFADGASFKISLDEVETLDELGKGNYGTVYKVRHSKPRMRRPGQGLAGNKVLAEGDDSSPSAANSGTGTGIVMAMKEMRLELEEAKFATIIMELDVLHRCISPYIVDFYGAFFAEGSVYICMEFMDGGSIDKIYGNGIPENVLRKITLATVMGLKSLKDEHNIIHRDVKPTNILVNTRGQVKICDFGVSGNLVASMAKTNIGCQSYMAPERISSGGIAQAGANPGGGTYSVQSDIWSLGLTIIECALGRYPYPPETYNNIFSQLSAIVDGEPPDLPEDSFSEAAKNFVRGCLNKIPNLRPTYAMLLQHAWLAPLVKPATIVEEDEEEAEAAANGTLPQPTSSSDIQTTDEAAFDREVADWAKDILEQKRNGTLGKGAPKPALHAAPLDAVSSPGPTNVDGLNGIQIPQTVA